MLYLVQNNYLLNKRGERKINDNALAALKSLAADSRSATEPAEGGTQSAETSASYSWRATIPVAVRVAALSELHSIELKRRRWWHTSSAHIFEALKRARSGRQVTTDCPPVLGALPYARLER